MFQLILVLISFNFYLKQMVDFVREGFLGSSHEFRNRQDSFYLNNSAAIFLFDFVSTCLIQPLYCAASKIP